MRPYQSAHYGDDPEKDARYADNTGPHDSGHLTPERRQGPIDKCADSSRKAQRDNSLCKKECSQH